MNGHLKVLVVDDHELVRAGMRRLLEENPQIGFIFEANSGEEALEMAATQPFDLVLMDISLPGINGLEASDKLLSLAPDSRIIMVTGKLEGGHIRKLLNAGVRGYITKGSSSDEMDKAMRIVMDGEQYLSPDVAQQVAMDVINGDNQNPFDKLTSRESEIITLLLRGHRNRQISSNLHISEKTVSTHRTRAFEKLQVKTTAELVRLAIRFDLWNED
ncbi:response regulator transcription factor [Granulosicoccus antarcticus]|uniref:Response regulator UvrY n=1 Tax=Granulosicoccus antarcticus IMCC3135 TaxID=1192854 RepID=A0A2Z2NXF0_9GAMM|nr:response regulator transcription factor [Granulosicoccus antarcticus]ASJ74438.1 Response regulator UvrY [Granulosicoccus antarcticus IMCC3135]